MYDDVILLVNSCFIDDEIGQKIPRETTRQVFCRVGNIARSEFFAAGQNGLNPEYRFDVFRGDYNGERTVVFHNCRYSVYRTYASNNDTIELYVERRAGS